MAPSAFTVKTHTFPGQHIRHFARANRHLDEDIQRLEAKQYTPISNPSPSDGDITILAAGAISFPKEVYEPLWEALLQHCQHHGLEIRSIWTLDRSDHAASATLNEDVLGDDQSPFDLARDLLLMTNLFREEFTLPILGFGHSMGGTALMELARLHPRLLASLVLIDPIVGPDVNKIGIPLVYGAAQRPDLWASREEAEKFFRGSGGMKRWHPEALRAYLEFGLRDTPTRGFAEAGKATLSTSKANESFAYVRPLFDETAVEGEDGEAEERRYAKYPDWQPGMSTRFYRGESLTVWNDLPALRPSVLYLFPQYGPFGTERQLEGFIGRTGTGAGGSGGRAAGRVRGEVLKGQGHLMPVESPDACAEVVAKYWVEELKPWHRHRRMAKEDGDGKSVEDGAVLSDEWKSQAKNWYKGHALRGRSKI